MFKNIFCWFVLLNLIFCSSIILKSEETVMGYQNDPLSSKFSLTNTPLQQNQKDPEIHFGEAGRLKFGLRTQFKYAYSKSENTHDIMIRRTRLKFEGSILKGTKFKVEIKSDDAGRAGKTNKTAVEDISLFLNFFEPNIVVRFGLYDAPFSRDSLTSDSKLLFMDRSDISEGYHSEGLADNAFGMEFFGLISDHLEYHVGIFDNDKLGTQSTQLMPMARLVGHILDSGAWTNGEYRATHPDGDKNILNVGMSIGYLGSINTSEDTYNLTGYEMDLFAAFKMGLSFQAEYGKVLKRKYESGLSDQNSDGWFVQAGYRIPWRKDNGHIELAYRIADYDPFAWEDPSINKKHSFGLNYYVLSHNFKIQADYTLIDRIDGPNDGVFQIQIQIDF